MCILPFWCIALCHPERSVTQPKDLGAWYPRPLPGQVQRIHPRPAPFRRSYDRVQVAKAAWKPRWMQKVHRLRSRTRTAQDDRAGWNPCASGLESAPRHHRALPYTYRNAACSIRYTSTPCHRHVEPDRKRPARHLLMQLAKRPLSDRKNVTSTIGSAMIDRKTCDANIDRYSVRYAAADRDNAYHHATRGW